MVLRASVSGLRWRLPPRRSASIWWLALTTVLATAAFAPLAYGRNLVDDADDAPFEWSRAADPASQDWAEIARRVDEEIVPLPKEPQVPLSWLRSQGGSAWGSFREPFPSVPVWNPPGPKRVGLQAGHWLYGEAPDELAELRSNPGTSGGGKAEWEVTLDIAERAAAMLRAAGVEVDLLPTTVPVRYRAHAFVSIHTDGDSSGVLNGYKLIGPGFSGAPEGDQALVDAFNKEYSAVTGLPRVDNQISRRMTYYYAFNGRRYQHAVAPGVPQVILETAFLTNAADRRLLLGDPDTIALGIANSVLKFLETSDSPNSG